MRVGKASARTHRCAFVRFAMQRSSSTAQEPPARIDANCLWAVCRATVHMHVCMPWNATAPDFPTIYTPQIARLVAMAIALFGGTGAESSIGFLPGDAMQEGVEEWLVTCAPCTGHR